MKKCEHCGATYLHKHGDDCPNRRIEDVQAIADVGAERQRQIRSEGWTPAHDDEHANNELGRAAACYLEYYLGGESEMTFDPDDGVPADWPWEPEAWKPKDPRRDLVRAAALIVAEIERLDRQESREDSEQ